MVNALYVYVPNLLRIFISWLIVYLWKNVKCIINIFKIIFMKCSAKFYLSALVLTLTLGLAVLTAFILIPRKTQKIFPQPNLQQNNISFPPASQPIQKVNARILQLEIQKNRQLQQQSQENSDSRSDKLKIFTIIIVVVVCVFIFIGIVIVVVWIIIKDRQDMRRKQDATKKYEVLFPVMRLQKFLNNYQHDWVDQCAICLQQYNSQNQQVMATKQSKRQILSQETYEQVSKKIFVQQTQKNQCQQQKKQRLKQNEEHIIAHNDQQSANIINLDPTDQQQLLDVQLTYCCHLLHQKCLDKWLEREHNCPICRQEFSIQNLKKFGSELGVTLFAVTDDNKQGQVHNLKIQEKVDRVIPQKNLSKQFSNQKENRQCFDKILSKHNRLIYRNEMKVIASEISDQRTSCMIKQSKGQGEENEDGKQSRKSKYSFTVEQLDL